MKSFLISYEIIKQTSKVIEAETQEEAEILFHNEFSLEQLNIITGANNSGKTTIFKAIQLLSDGLQKSDFPLLELNNENFNFTFFISILKCTK